MSKRMIQILVSTLLVMVLSLYSFSSAFATEEEFGDLRKLMNNFQEKTGCELQLEIDEHSHLVLSFAYENQDASQKSYHRVLTNDELYCDTATALFYLNQNVIHELVEKHASGETNQLCNTEYSTHPTFYGDENDNFFVNYVELKKSFKDVTGFDLELYVFEPSGFISFGFYSNHGYEARIIGCNEYIIVDSNVFYLDPIVYYDLINLYTRSCD